MIAWPELYNYSNQTTSTRADRGSGSVAGDSFSYYGIVSEILEIIEIIEEPPLPGIVPIRTLRTVNPMWSKPIRHFYRLHEEKRKGLKR